MAFLFISNHPDVKILAFQGLIPAHTKYRGHVLNFEGLSLFISLSTFLRTFLSLPTLVAALQTAWDTADSLTPN
jgi:hypothetical protein